MDLNLLFCYPFLAEQLAKTWKVSTTEADTLIETLTAVMKSEAVRAKLILVTEEKRDRFAKQMMNWVE